MFRVKRSKYNHLHRADVDAVPLLASAALRTSAPQHGSTVQVLSLLAEGASNKSIALRLGISVHTVTFHVASLLDKFEPSAAPMPSHRQCASG